MILHTDDNDVDQLTVEVESKKVLNQIDQQQLAGSLKLEMKNVIVFTPEVNVLPPNTITQEGLKAKRVVDNRKKE